jgi:ABC-type transport system involved in multi-copper enzyme maturation permease subunit
MSQAIIEVVPKARGKVARRLGALILWLSLVALVAGTVWFALGRPLLFVLVGLELLIAAWVLRPAGVHYLGPHFYYDLIRLARRGHNTPLRILYGLLLGAALFFVYAYQTGRYPRDVLFGPAPVFDPPVMAAFAPGFVVAALAMQFLGMLILTPAYIAGAITEEREGRTLELLLTTHLTDREIVLGKMCARLAHLGGVVLTGLPILSFTQFWGGVDGWMILRGFADTFLVMLIAGCVSIAVSARARSVSTAELESYGLLLLLAIGVVIIWCCFGIPIAALLTDWFTLALLGLAMASAVISLPLAMSSLRPEARPALARFAVGRDRGRRRTVAPVVPRPRSTAASPVPAAGTILAGNYQLPVPVRAPRQPLSALPPIEGDALLWKERNLPKTAFSPYWLSFFALLAVFILVQWSSRSGPQGVRQSVVRAGAILLAGYVCFGVSMRAAGCIVRERQQKTLESLLLLPMTAAELLTRKWLGPLLSYRVHLLVLAFVVLLTVLVGIIHPIGAALAVLAILVHVAFLTTLGMGVSAVAQKPIEAHFALAILLVLVFGAPWWWLALSDMWPGSWWYAVLDVGLNPVGSWNFLLFTWNDFRPGDGEFAHRLTIALAGLCIYAVAAAGVWLLTGVLFGERSS